MVNLADDFIKKVWFELNANFCPVFGAKIQKIGKTVFTEENIKLLEDILKNVKENEKDPNKLETIKYICWGIQRLTGVIPNDNKTK